MKKLFPDYFIEGYLDSRISLAYLIVLTLFYSGGTDNFSVV